jgi:NTP pyrophosphatase (non-canonical NTP hydrolase)
MDKKESYKRAIALRGNRKQMRMVQEECAELIVAISHFLRHLDREEVWNKDESVDSLIEETADVFIMIEQMKLMVGPDAVDKVMEEKMTRFEKKLKKYEEK